MFEFDEGSMTKHGEEPDLVLVEPRSPQVPQPSRKLRRHGLALWSRVQNEYVIADSGGVELLMQACAAVDRAETLAERIAADGEVVHTRSGVPKAHPALKDELAARAFVVYAH
jgi:hypothetical protein